MSLQAIEAALAAEIETRCAAVAAAGGVMTFEPEALPTALPCVTIMYARIEPVDAETGGAAPEASVFQDVTHTWRVRLYLDLGQGYEAAQDQLKTLLPQVVAAMRWNPTLGRLIELGRFTDDGRDPVFAHRSGWLAKGLRFSATVQEST